MKRWFVMLTMALAAVAAPAAETAEAVSYSQSYDMTVDMRKLGCVLGLTFRQMDDFDYSYERFNQTMSEAAKSAGESRDAMVKKAVEENFKEMKFILKSAQYEKYKRLITVTLINRGILQG